MSIFAIVKDGKVENAVEAESKDLLQALLPDAELLEVTDATGVAYVGHGYDSQEGKFISPQPFDSWTFDKVSWSWISPIDYPAVQGKFFAWDEEALNWTEITEEPIVAE